MVEKLTWSKNLFLSDRTRKLTFQYTSIFECYEILEISQTNLKSKGTTETEKHFTEMWQPENMQHSQREMWRKPSKHSLLRHMQERVGCRKLAYLPPFQDYVSYGLCMWCKNEPINARFLWGFCRVNSGALCGFPVFVFPPECSWHVWFKAKRRKKNTGSGEKFYTTRCKSKTEDVINSACGTLEIIFSAIKETTHQICISVYKSIKLENINRILIDILHVLIFIHIRNNCYTDLDFYCVCVYSPNRNSLNEKYDHRSFNRLLPSFLHSKRFILKALQVLVETQWNVGSSCCSFWESCYWLGKSQIDHRIIPEDGELYVYREPD